MFIKMQALVQNLTKN